MELFASFFDRYARAYLAGDPTVFTDFFDFPCLIVDSNGDHVLREEHDLEDYERAFVASLKKDGVRKIEVESLREIALGGAEALCSNRYRVLASDRRLIGDMEYHYVLQGRDGRWRIKFARMGTLHDWRG